MLAEQVMTPRQVKEFAEKKEADFAIGVPGVGRFRTNIYQQRGTLAFAFRAIPYEVKTIARAAPAGGARGDRAQAARADPGHRHHRLGQVHRAGRDDQPRQPEPPGQRHHDRGPDRVPPPRRDVQHLPARGRERHAVVRLRAAPRAAPGPRRDPGRRDPRHGDAGHGAQGGRHRATWCSARCTRPTPPRRSTASSRSIRPTSTRRSGCCWPPRCRPWCRSGWCRGRTGGGACPRPRC